LLVGDQHSLVQAGLINRLTDSAESIKPLLATTALVEEASNRLFDQFVAAPIVAVSEFLLDLFCQIRRQRYFHDRLSLFILRVHGAITRVTVEGVVGHVEISKEGNAEADPTARSLYPSGHPKQTPRSTK
jgi:hypothetical protein